MYREGPHPAPTSNVSASIPWTLVYSIPDTSPLSGYYANGLDNFAALAVSRQKQRIVLSANEGGTRGRCERSNFEKVVEQVLRSELRSLHSRIEVTITSSDTDTGRLSVTS
jgi:hypothetical protein